jgi:hypothetical protein
MKTDKLSLLAEILNFTVTIPVRSSDVFISCKDRKLCDVSLLCGVHEMTIVYKIKILEGMYELRNSTNRF